MSSADFDDKTASAWWQSIQWPVLGLVVAGLLLAVAYGLDGGSVVQRDTALLIGTLTLYGLIPLMTIWLVVAATMRYRSRKPRLDH